MDWITKNLANGKKLFSTLFKSETSRFYLFIGLKVSLIPAFTSLFVIFVFYIFIKNNYAYLQSFGYAGFLNYQEALYDYFIEEIVGLLPFIMVFFVSTFFVGMYLAALLLRPFELISIYCDQKCSGDKNVIYQPDLFSELKLLARFSEFFFSYANDVEKSTTLTTSSIPPLYNRIRKPKFESSFFFHFVLFLSIVCIGVSYFILSIASTIHEKTIKLALTALQNSKVLGYSQYMSSQRELLEMTLVISVSILVVLYIWLAFSLYNKVAPAAFGVFSTMRSFIKGNFSSRVHLIGYNHLREHTRSFNKYLDQIVRCYSTDGQIDVNDKEYQKQGSNKIKKQGKVTKAS